MGNRSALITVMTNAALKASKRLIRDFNEVEKLQVSQKGPGDFVTLADQRTESFLKEELEKARPDYGFIMEESGVIHGKDEEVYWVIDPIDGTTNFLHGLPYFAINIALVQIDPKKGLKVIAGVTYNPIANELFWAEEKCGAWCEDANGRLHKLGVSKRKELDHAAIAVGSVTRDPEQAKILASQVAAIRAIGSSALSLAYVAAGRADGFIQRKLYLWDVAAGVRMVQEAGGRVSLSCSTKNLAGHCHIIAANNSLAKKLAFA